MKIFVLGWYGHGNLGDEAFRPAIKNLFPDQQFQFGDHIPDKINQDYDELWVGGGSFLDQRLKNIELVTIPIGFIGVGIGHTVEPHNLAALRRAKFVIVRDHVSVRRCPNAYFAPDVVFSRKDLHAVPRPANTQKNVVVLLNDFFYPGWECPEWKSFSFYRFSQEFAKVCESFASEGYWIKFLPMCVTTDIDDRKIAGALISRMKTKSKAVWYTDKIITEHFMMDQIAKADVVITQRLHGAIYAMIAQRPVVVIRAHDKLAGLLEDTQWSGHLDYYGFTDKEFFDVFRKIEGKSIAKEYIEYAQKRWGELREIAVKSKKDS